MQIDLGFSAYTAGGAKTPIDVFMITLGGLMVGTAGLPHIIIRFFTTPTIKGARASAGWALLFIAILYTTAPAVAAFARLEPDPLSERQELRRGADLVQELGEDRPRRLEGPQRRRKDAVREGRAVQGQARVREGRGGRRQARAFWRARRQVGLQRQEHERALRRPRHHRPRQPRDRPAAELGRRPRGGRRTGRRSLDRRRPPPRHRVRDLARPGQERRREGHDREGRVPLGRAPRPVPRSSLRATSGSTHPASSRRS